MPRGNPPFLADEEVPHPSAEAWETAACARCGPGAPAKIIWEDRERGDIWRCQRCGLAYRSPRRREAYLTRYFADAWKEDEAACRQENRRHYLRYVLRQVLARHPWPGAWLDVGSGQGDLLALVPRTWQRFGLDPSLTSCQVARKRLAGAAILEGTLAAAPFRDKAFDVITMIATIYFLPYPLRDLKRCRSLLKPDGILAVHSLNFANRGPLYRLIKRSFAGEWLYFYTPETLGGLLAEAGFRVIDRLDLPGFRFFSRNRWQRLLARVEFSLAKVLRFLLGKRLDPFPHFLLLAQPEQPGKAGRLPEIR